MLLPSEVVEQGWTKRVSARDPNGSMVNPFSPIARCWCAGAAIEYAFRDKTTIKYNYINNILLKIGPYHTVVSWNDSPDRTKQEVIQLLQEVEKEMNLA